MGRTQEYIQKEYGFPLEVVEHIHVLGAVVPVEILPNDPNRVAWTIFNVGAGIGYVAFSSAVGAAFGMQMAGNGGFISTNAREDGEVPCRSLWAIGAAATTLYIFETRAVG